MALLKFSKRKRLLLAMAIAVIAIGITYPYWLAVSGKFLVKAESPAPAEIIVVLAGDGWGKRILKGAELVKRGYASKVLVSGPPGFYGTYESDLAIPFAVRAGYPAEWFLPFPNDGMSTKEEAVRVLDELRRRNVHSFLLVTSNYHTRRAGNIYRDYAKDFRFRVVASPDQAFEPSTWWHTRQGRKAWFFEWLKTVTSVFGI